MLTLLNSLTSRICSGFALRVNHQKTNQEILFATCEDALRFNSFCWLYQSNTEMSNSYGSYHARSVREQPTPILVRTRHDFEPINTDVVASMFQAICTKRLLFGPLDQWLTVAEQWNPAFPKIGLRDGAFTFQFDSQKLPPRIAPTERGQFVLYVDDPRAERSAYYFVREHEGRALIATFDPNRPPNVSDLKVVPTSALMVIHDYRQESEVRRHQWGYWHQRNVLLEFADKCIDDAGSNLRTRAFRRLSH